MSKNFEDVQKGVLLWADDRDLLHEASAWKQLLKTVSEVGELADAFIEVDDEEIIDAVGDVVVCLTIFSEQLGLDVVECFEAAYECIKDRKGETVDGVFIKE